MTIDEMSLEVETIQLVTRGLETSWLPCNYFHHGEQRKRISVSKISSPFGILSCSYCHANFLFSITEQNEYIEAYFF